MWAATLTLQQGIDLRYHTKPSPKSKFSSNGPQRYLGWLPILALSATLQLSWESVGGSLQAGLYNGGPASLVYGQMLAILGSIALCLSFAELASMLVCQCCGGLGG